MATSIEAKMTCSSMCACRDATTREGLMTRLVMPRFPQHCMMGKRRPPQSLTVARSGPSPRVHSQRDAWHLWCYGICTQATRLHRLLRGYSHWSACIWSKVDEIRAVLKIGHWLNECWHEGNTYLWATMRLKYNNTVRDVISCAARRFNQSLKTSLCFPKMHM